MTDKKSEQNPIEEAIGDRTKPKVEGNLADLPENATLTPTETKYQAEPTPDSNSRSNPDEPSPSELLVLEELNQQAVEKLGDQYPEEPTAPITGTKIPPVKKTVVEKTVLKETPASPQDRPPVTKTCSQESHPPQKNKTDIIKACEKIRDVGYQRAAQEAVAEITANRPTGAKLTNLFPAEDIELTALRDFIFDSGFTPAGVAFHIVALCSQPLVTTSTTNWDFKDRASIPDMVFALLRQPGYIEGIYPSLKIVMSDNIGNAQWSAGVATTIAYFDTIRVLPSLKEMKNDS